MSDDQDDENNISPEEKRAEMKKKAMTEQVMAEIADRMPSFWFRMYSNCIREGFSETQAMDLVKTHILGLASQR